MQNKELISKIKELNSITPDQTWKNETRSFLYAKISAAPTSPLAEINILETILIHTKKFFAQPSFAIVAMVALVISAALFGPRAINIMPGDSLYIARIISEEAQLAITFDQKAKTKLGIKFSSDRAKQITDVLAQAKFESSAESEKLSNDFKNELAIVRTKINEMKETNEVAVNEEETNEEENMFFTAGLEKEPEGMEIFIPENDPENNIAVEPEPTPASANEEMTNALEQILISAEELFDLQDYEGAKNKISEADTLLEEASETPAENPEENSDEAPAAATSSEENSETN